MNLLRILLSKQPQGFRSFITKLLVFCVLFILVSGIVGPWIISTKLLYGFSFYIYANMGKMILFSALAFIILTRDHIKQIKHINYDRYNIFFIILSFILTGVFFYAANQLLDQKSLSSNIGLSIITHLLLISVPLFLAIGVFGLKFIRYFVFTFKKEIAICLILSVIFYFSIFEVWKLWPYFSNAVLKSVAFLLSLHITPVKDVGNLTLFVRNFTVRIEEACSGLDSIFLFTALYTLVSLVDWKKFNHTKLILAFIPAVIGMFIVNIIRVYALILIGVY
ncbi:MAG: archaeosortase/exosortase family protein, partial [Weeksellaceae bacterium]